MIEFEDEIVSFDEEGNMILPTSYLFGHPDPPAIFRTS